MRSECQGRQPARHQRGFTLIELMIVMTVIAILAAIAYPGFMGQVRKSRRGDAVQALGQVQQAQERARANAPTYVTASASITTAQPAGLGLGSATSAGGYYTLTLGTNGTAGCTTGTCYIATATAVAGTSQAADTGCTAMVATMDRGNTTYTPAACWSR